MTKTLDLVYLAQVPSSPSRATRRLHGVAGNTDQFVSCSGQRETLPKNETIFYSAERIPPASRTPAACYGLGGHNLIKLEGLIHRIRPASSRGKLPTEYQQPSFGRFLNWCIVLTAMFHPHARESHRAPPTSPRKREVSSTARRAIPIQCRNGRRVVSLGVLGAACGVACLSGLGLQGMSVAGVAGTR